MGWFEREGSMSAMIGHDSDGRSQYTAGTDGLPGSEQVYQQLRDMILWGELPTQTCLVEEHLAERFGVSRTVVRDALQRLASETLVCSDPVRGLVVHEPDSPEVCDMYLVREELESLAARLAAQRITPGEIRQLHAAHDSMREGLDAGQVDDVISANLIFHGLIYRSARNGALFGMANDMTDLVRRFSADSFADAQRSAVVLTEHGAIMAAIERHDGDAAADASSQHMQATSAHIREIRGRSRLSPHAARYGHAAPTLNGTAQIY
jgi:DNA-binding GntR family transcriptional regulator